MKENLRKIRSYVRREGRITKAQKKALDELLPKYGIDAVIEANAVCFDDKIILEAQHALSKLNFSEIFNRSADIILEIGFGMGDALIQMAEEHPECNFIGIDVYAPGVGSVLRELDQRQIKNTRLIHGDAVDVLETKVPEQSLSRIHIYFPDPWQKKRHHKRRLIQSDFIKLLLKKLKQNGVLHIVTDDDSYAEHIREVLSLFPALKPNAITDNKDFKRPVTKFERRAKQLNHRIHDFLYLKCE